MRTYIIAFILTLPCLALGQSLDIPLVTTTATAEIYVPVDEVHFNLTISQKEAGISAARNKNIEVAKKVTDILKSKGVPAKYIQTAAMSVDRNYVRNSGFKKWDGFICTQKIYVCLLDPAKYDAIVDELLTTDLASLKGPEFKSSKLSEAMEKARGKAILLAKKKAEQFASTLGQSIGPAKLIEEISSGQTGTLSYSNDSSSNLSLEGKSQSFEPGQLRVQSSVTVSFELKE